MYPPRGYMYPLPPGIQKYGSNVVNFGLPDKHKPGVHASRGRTGRTFN